MSRSTFFPLLALVIVLLTCYGSVNAQQPSTGAAAPSAVAPLVTEAVTEQPLNFETFIERAGVMAWPLVILSTIAVCLIVLYTLTIRQGTVVSDSFMNQADALIRKQDYLGLLSVCTRRNECIARITAKTLDFATRNPTAAFEEVKEVTEAEGNRQASLLLSRIAYLGDVGAVAPMLGLLGTTLGMITTFSEMTSKNYGASGQMGLAEGVSEALLCTASGLVIGIPSLIFYSIFRGKANRLISEMEAATTHVMALLAVQYKRAARAVGTGKAPGDGSAM